MWPRGLDPTCALIVCKNHCNLLIGKVAAPRLLFCVCKTMCSGVERGIWVSYSYTFRSICSFDTVDHELLLETVERGVGLGGRCLDWVRGYLNNRV